MRLASVFCDGVPSVVAQRGDEVVLVRAEAELGVDLPFEELRDPGADAKPLDQRSLVWRPVVPAPRRVICLGLNYHAHVQETGRELPDYPVLFCKWASSLLAAGAPVALPPESHAVDYEAELAIVIGTPGRRIAAERALEHVAGVTVANDITMRDYQFRSRQWLQGKAWEASTPLGPYLVTLDELSDIGRLDIRLTLNGEVMQSSNTERLIFDVPTIIATISEFTTLDRGDVILTGTPGGVGFQREPKVLLAAGDELTVEVPGVGTLTNRIVAEA